MRNSLQGAAVLAALLTSAAHGAEFPPSPAPRTAEEAFAGRVPTVAGLPLGSAYASVEATFEAAGDAFQLKRGNRELRLGNDRDGSVEYGFPETLQLAGKAGVGGDIREDRTATFSSPLTGSQMLTLVRDIAPAGTTELSVPDFEKAIVAALGEPTGRYTETTPKWSYVWIDGRLVAGTEVPQLVATVGATMEAVGIGDGDLTLLEGRIDRCAGLMKPLGNDPLIDISNEVASGRDVPDDCTAMATVTFYPGSQLDLSRRIEVRLFYAQAIVEDAKAVGTFVRDALRSGAGRKSGVAIDKF
ncbi:hypothetical protein [Aureimonas jatrophae]|uniref:Uncharacterized protein n=1 Tax=Aureimonas jatrophae TaxID=1166073 RepID=A0A1H0M574_9HYPH|nr:hypothetical protein [Aureimonas jatrophae]MBB3952623.1 hypothetical protein [Aureimonas jatrophae]SDO75451.1 hypothetical protein SAMN05192530_11269 [Aureimonas jatrophae]